ncbi:MAG: DUF5685 family protein [Eubacteriales bacterium]|nr:DUF5685 family protein [Eubacteriales bacterium]
MFGYLSASPRLLTEEELSRYKAAYCGLCRALKERYGQLSRLTLNYDMTFLVLLLNSLYEPEEISGNNACIAHPVEKRSWWKSEYTDYAADMNIALSYLKCRDDWKDDRKLLSLSEAKLLEKAYCAVKEKYPRQCQAMESSIRSLSEIEKENVEDPDAASSTFGALLGEVFIYRDDIWHDMLYNTGCGLGRFIYLLDAVIDLERDAASGAYNPFKMYCGKPDNEQRFRDILKIFLGDAVSSFNMLPLVQDVSILNNILCIGLWSQFENKYHPLTKEQIREMRKTAAEGKK